MESSALLEASSAGALLRAVGACLVVALLLPLTILSALVRKLSGGRTPSVVSLLDGPVFTPYELRRVKHEHIADETHGFWKRVGDRVAVRPGADGDGRRWRSCWSCASA